MKEALQPVKFDTKSLKKRTRIGIQDTFGLRPLNTKLKQLFMIFRGDPDVPPTKFGISSTKIFKPSISWPTWLNIRRKDKRIPIYNFFNHTPTPLEEGWSVKVTQVKDFRGGRLTYDSHNGTDFAIPVGTQVVTSAPGQILLISDDFNRGGLKIFIDHGQGIITTYNHLGRALVKVGDIVERGQTIALSGASGADAFLCFPWVAPHVHFNVWLNGQYIDPFALQDSEQISLWRAGAHPLPHDATEDSEDYKPTDWDTESIQQGIEACKNADIRQKLLAIQDTGQQAMFLLMQQNYYPTRFASRPSLYKEAFSRIPLLDLPFRAEDFIGVTYPGFSG